MREGAWRGRGGPGVGGARAAGAGSRGVTAGQRGGLSGSGSGRLPPAEGLLLSMASGGGGTGAAASANLNAVRETMDGECASRSFSPARASRPRAPGGGVTEGPAVPASNPAPSCEGLGMGPAATAKLAGLLERRPAAAAELGARAAFRPRVGCLRAQPGSARPAPVPGASLWCLTSS